MNSWNETANRLWQAILARIGELKDEGETLQSIADKVGVKSRTIVHYWLSGSRKADGSPFADLMTYAERLGLDYRNYFPGGEPPAQPPTPSCAACKKLMTKEKENQKLQKEVERLKLELAGAQGEVRALERQLNRRESAEQAGRRPRTKGALQGDTVRGSEEALASRRQA